MKAEETLKLAQAKAALLEANKAPKRPGAALRCASRLRSLRRF